MPNSNKKILLVYPEYPETFWSFKYALKFISKKASLPPLGLLTVAAMLPKEWEKKLIDMTVTKLKDKHIKWADYVFVSAMSIQKKFVDKVISRCKALGARVVCGGPLFTARYKEFKNVDHLVLNEAQTTLPLFLKDLENGNPKRIYKSDKWADMSKVPVPLLELVNMKKYARMCIQYSRGCPFNCDFCDVTKLFGRGIRTKTKEQVLRELESLYQIGWRDGVFIVDDNFIGNKRELKKEILPAMTKWLKEREYPFSFNTQVSINIADDEELMRMMREAGFNSLFVGIETPNEKSLEECEKHQNKNRDMVACVKKIQRFGLQVHGGFILGFDSDPPAIFKRLFNFIQQSGIVTAMVGLLNAPCGTKLYNKLKKQGRLLRNSSGDNTDLSMNFVPKMNQKTLVDGYKKVLRLVYSPKYFYKRVMTFLNDLGEFKARKVQLHPYYLGALVKSIWTLGIKSGERFYYWKLFFWSLFKRPRVLPWAITLAIYGFHFRKIYRRY